MGEITSLTSAALNWPTLTAADPDAEPDRYLVQLRPGADPETYAAAVGAQEPDSLTVQPTSRVVATRNTPTSTDDVGSRLVLGLVAAAGVFATMLLHVRERSRDIAVLKAVGMSPRSS